MKDLRKTLGIAVVAIALMGAGCSGAAPTSTPQATTPAPTPAPVVEAPKEPVKFSEVKTDLFGLAGVYSELTFSNATGTCATKLPYKDLSYSPSQPGYNYMLREAGEKIDDMMSSNIQSILFEATTVDGAKADCVLKTPYGSDTATITCSDAAEKEVCSGTYDIMAQPE